MSSDEKKKVVSSGIRSGCIAALVFLAAFAFFAMVGSCLNRAAKTAPAEHGASINGDLRMGH